MQDSTFKLSRRPAKRSQRCRGEQESSTARSLASLAPPTRRHRWNGLRGCLTCCYTSIPSARHAPGCPDGRGPESATHFSDEAVFSSRRLRAGLSVAGRVIKLLAEEQYRLGHGLNACVAVCTRPSVRLCQLRARHPLFFARQLTDVSSSTASLCSTRRQRRRRRVERLVRIGRVRSVPPQQITDGLHTSPDDIGNALSESGMSLVGTGVSSLPPSPFLPC